MNQERTVSLIDYYRYLLNTFHVAEVNKVVDQNIINQLVQRWKNPKISIGNKHFVTLDDFDDNTLNKDQNILPNENERRVILDKYNINDIPTPLQELTELIQIYSPQSSSSLSLIQEYNPPPSPPPLDNTIRQRGMRISSSSSEPEEEEEEEDDDEEKEEGKKPKIIRKRKRRISSSSSSSFETKERNTKRKRRSSSSSGGGAAAAAANPKRKRRSSSSSSKRGAAKKPAAAAATKNKRGRPKGSVNKVKMGHLTLVHPNTKKSLAKMQCEIAGDKEQRGRVRDTLKELGFKTVDNPDDNINLSANCSRAILNNIYKQ